VTLTALQSVTSTELSSSGSPSFPGSPVTFTATVSTRTAPVATGSVSFIQGTTVLATVPVDAEGTAAFTTTSLPVGTTSITAVYGAAGPNLGSTSNTVSQSVVPFSTVTSLGAAPNPSPFGQPVNLTATVTAQGLPVTAGTVSFYRGNQYLGTAALNSSGAASLTVSLLPAGLVRIQATYSGTTNDLSSVSQIVAQSVLPAPTATTLVVTTETLPSGATRYLLVATVTTQGNIGLAPSGTVVFRRNGRVLGKAALRNGTAVLSLGRRPPHSGSYVAKFQGSARFGASSSPAIAPS
jgi:Bacterial Ig-like domain (group 3)